MDRERRIRERVARAFGERRREDFGSDAAWNNFLEEREDIAFNLVEGIDVEASERRLRAVEAENADAIAATQALEVDMQQQAADPNPPGTAEAVAPAPAGQSSPDGIAAAGAGGNGDAHMQTPEAERIQLALLASGWSMELVRRRAIQEAMDTCVF